MKKKFGSAALCLLTAIIWGFAFSAQEIASRSSDLIDAFFFNGIRFAIGSISLIPVIMLFEREKNIDKKKLKNTIVYGMITGCFLFAATAFQQFGIQLTGESGKAGFITGMYLIFVPIVSFIIFRQRISPFVWCGMVFAIVGLYFLCMGDSVFTIKPGDALVLVSSFFYTGHIIVIDKFIGKVSPLKYSSIQFMTVAFLNIIFGLIFGHITWEGVVATIYPILYCGIMSTGVAYTCQMFGQKHTPPAIAALLFSTEGLFSVVAECIVKRALPTRMILLGCSLMFVGIIFSQLPNPKDFRRHKDKSIE